MRKNFKRLLASALAAFIVTFCISSGISALITPATAETETTGEIADAAVYIPEEDIAYDPAACTYWTTVIVDGEWDTAWVVDYTDAFGEAEAAEDGSVTQWDYAYFTAHRWSAQGETIASMPQYVLLDDVLYEYVEFWYDDYEDPESYSWDEILYIRANGGIVFQTCAPDETGNKTGIVEVLYEPVDSEGYTAHQGESAVLCDYDEL